MICSKCGAENDPNADKCSKCGWWLQSRLAVEDQGCANHPWRFATSVCYSCGVELCEECEVLLDGKVYCAECASRPEEDALLQDVKLVDPVVAVPAGLWIRTIALSIDLLILACAASVLWIAFWLGTGDAAAPISPMDHPWPHAVFWALVAVGAPVYFIESIALNAQTPGMASVDIAVVRYTGEVIGRRTALLRFLAIFPTMVSVFGIICALWDRHKRMLHDRLTQTRVVRIGSNY